MRIIYPKVVTHAGLYDEVADELQITTDHPEGLIMHAAGKSHGEWRIVEIWESDEYALQFDAERLQPAIKALTGKRGSPPPVEQLELHQLVTP